MKRLLRGLTGSELRGAGFTFVAAGCLTIFLTSLASAWVGGQAMAVGAVVAAVLAGLALVLGMYADAKLDCEHAREQAATLKQLSASTQSMAQATATITELRTQNAQLYSEIMKMSQETRGDD